MQGNDTFREASAAIGTPPHIDGKLELHPKRGRPTFGASANDLFSLMGHATRPSGLRTVSATSVAGDLPDPRRPRGGDCHSRPATFDITNHHDSEKENSK